MAGSAWPSESDCKGRVDTVGLAGGVGVAARPKRDAKEVESRDAAAAAVGGVLEAPRLTARAAGRGGRGGFDGDDPLGAGRGGRGREA